MSDLSDDAPLSSLLTGGDRSILLRGGLAHACQLVLKQSSAQIKHQAEQLICAKTRSYEQKCEAHRLTVVCPVQYKSRQWCADWRVARETRDWAVRRGHISEHHAKAITFAHANAGTPVQAPSGHRVILPGPPSSSDQL